jgi:hypothetical protein
VSEDASIGQQGRGRGGAEAGAVLVLATEELAGDAVEKVAAEIRRTAAGDAPAVRVVSPTLASSALKHQFNDVDEAMEPARRRLEATVGALREAGLRADGEVGDADPLLAIKDELLKAEIDRILLVTHERDEDSAYAEKELLERVGREVEQPATELRIVGHDADERVVGTDRAAAGKTRGEEGRRISANLPPLRSLDAAGLFVAVAGTVVLFLLAGGCSNEAHEAGEPTSTITGDCVARYLLAGAFFLINIAHVVGLLLMSSVNYRGPFERFIARISLYGTPVAIAVSAVIGG